VRKLTSKITKNIILLMALILISSLCFVDLTWVNALSDPVFVMQVSSPMENTTYVGDVEVIVFVTYNSWLSEQSFQTDCYLDGQFYSQINLVNKDEGSGPTLKDEDYEPGIAIGNISLRYLPDGAHTLEVKCIATGHWSVYPGPNPNETLGSGRIVFFEESQLNNLSNNSYSTLVMVLSGVIAGAVIVSVAIVVIYRKQILKRKGQVTQEV
jgi:hypothetical protein